MSKLDELQRLFSEAQQRWIQQVRQSNYMFSAWKVARNNLLHDRPFLGAAQICEKDWYDGVCTVLTLDRRGMLRWFDDFEPSLDTHLALLSILEKVPAEHILQRLAQLGGFTSIRLRIYEDKEWHNLRGEEQNFLLSLSLGMMPIPGGVYTIGSDRKDSDAFSPQKVKTEPFYIGQFQVTQALYVAISSRNPSRFKGMSRPVESISWHDAIRFCNMLSKVQKLQPCYVLGHHDEDVDGFECTPVHWQVSANGYRLPLEIEWEIAACSGHQALFAGVSKGDMVGWFQENSRNTTHAVGQRLGAPSGTFDMSGNIAEWCWDSYTSATVKEEEEGVDIEVYHEPPPQDPIRAMLGLPDYSRPRPKIIEDESAKKIARGGGWLDSVYKSYITNRARFYPSICDGNVGFRLVRSSL